MARSVVSLRKRRTFLFVVAALLIVFAAALPAVASAAVTGAAVTINGGDPYVNQTAVTVGLSYAGAAGPVVVSVDSGATWEAFSATKPYTLTGPDGTSTATVLFSDDAHVTSVPASDTIMLDRVAPVTTAPGADATYYSTSQTLAFTAFTDPVPASGVISFQYKIDAGAWQSVLPVAPVNVILSSALGDGTHTVWYRSVDAAGNVETTGVPGAYKSVARTFDTAAPSVNATGFDMLWHADQHWTIQISAADMGSGVASITYQIGAAAPVTTMGAGPVTVDVDPATLADGTVAFTYYATDAADPANSSGTYSGNLLVDRVAPVSAINAPATPDLSLWYSAPFGITFAATDPGFPDASGVDRVIAKIDSLAWVKGNVFTVPTPANHSLDGPQVVSWQAIDKAVVTSNAEAVQTVGVNIDTQAPTTLPTYTPAPVGLNDFYNVDVPVTLTATDPMPGSGVRYIHWRIGASGDWTTFTGASTIVTVPAPAAAVATSTLHFFADDNAIPSNQESVKSLELKFDTQAPVTTIHGLDDAWHSIPVTGTFTATDFDGVGVQATNFRLLAPDGSLYLDWTGGTSFTVPAAPTHQNDGIWTVQYASVDKLGNVEITKSAEVKIDTYAPLTTAAAITHVPGDPFDTSLYYSSDVVVEFTVTDPSAPVSAGVDYTEYRIDGIGEWVKGTSATIPAVGTAAHFVEYRSVDKSVPPNVESIKRFPELASQWILIDTQAPDAYFSNANEAWRNTPLDLNFATHGDPSGTYPDGSFLLGSGFDHFEYSLDGGGWITGTSVYISAPSNGSNDGLHTIHLMSFDKAVTPNHTDPHASTTVGIDTQAPTTTAPTGWFRSGGMYAITATDQVGRSGVDYTMYRVDTGAWTEYTGAFELTGATGSGHTIDAYSVDNAGNTEAIRSFNVTMDATPPVTVASGWDNNWHSENVTVSFTATDVGAGVGPNAIEYSVTPESASSPGAWTIGNAVVVSQNGVNKVWMRATDLAQPTGNVETAHFVTVKIDNNGPETSLSSVAEWNRGPVNVTITVDGQSSGVAKIMYSVDGNEMSTTENPTTITVTGDGAHVVRAWGVSTAGVVGNVASVSFKIDSIGPVMYGKDVSGRVAHNIRLKYKGTDGMSPKLNNVKLVVKNSRGRTVKTITVGTINKGAWFYKNWKPTKKGTYKYYVYGKDYAGNRQISKGWGKITVR